MKTCCFTGHRTLKFTQELCDNLAVTLTGLIDSGVTDFYAGGALGWDMFCEKMILRLKKDFPHIRLHLVLPCPPENQTYNWNDEAKAAYYKIMNAADSTETISETYYSGCMQKRNQKLVDLADVCVCYYTNFRSGTGQTVRMAQKKNIRIINLAGNTSF